MTTQTPGASAPATSPIETCHTVFGQYPEDVLSIVRTADEALGWLNYLFHEIKKLSKFERSDDAANLCVRLLDIKKLSGMGRYVSCDIGEYIEREAENMAEHLKAFEAREGGEA
jgi:hypothetical protein